MNTTKHKPMSQAKTTPDRLVIVGSKVTSRFDERDFHISETLNIQLRANACHSPEYGGKNSRLANKWALENRSKITKMSFGQIVDALDQIGVRYCRYNVASDGTVLAIDSTEE